jgi:hypothetical protein
MMTLARLTCLWPGLPRLWFRGDWTGLLSAGGFAAIVNFLVITTLLWPEIAPGPLCAVGCVFAVLWWGVGLVLSLREWPQIMAATDDDPYQGLFIAAQTEYVKGNWIVAEAHLRKLLRRRPRDVESLLLLAAIARRTDRFDEARAQLQNLARLEAAARWQTEIRCERELLRRLAEKRRLKKIEQEQVESETTTPDDVNDDPPHSHPSQNDDNDVKEAAAPPDVPWHDRRAA